MSRAWLLLTVPLLGGCPKASGTDPSAATRGAPAGATAREPSALLQAELRRDPTAITEDDLLAQDGARRLAAVRSLARIEDERSFEPLRKALADEEPAVIEWAAFGVGELCRGREPEAVRRLALRAASLAAEAVTPARDRAIGSIAFALGRCASDEAEKTLRSWLELRAPLSESAALGLGQVARSRRHLDDATVAALLDAAGHGRGGSALYPIESLPTLGAAARDRLREVAVEALAAPGPGRAFALRALAKAGAAAAAPLRRELERHDTPDAERADAARSLAALGAAGQAELAGALAIRARALLDAKAWLTTQVGVVLTLLEGLEPKRADAELLRELAQLPLADEPPPVLRRKVMVRCRAAALLANRSSASPALVACDPAAPDARREGSLAVLSVLGRGPLTQARGTRFRELAGSSDGVVREAALELLIAHDEVEDVPELLASALSAPEPGVRATAAKVLARFPSRAQQTRPRPDGATPPTDPRVVQALTRQLAEVGVSNDVELSGWLLDAAAALELLGVKPALERACSSTNPTLRQHAEKAYAGLGDAQHRCPSVAGTEEWRPGATPDYRLEFATDVGPLSITLWGDKSPFATRRFVELSRAHFFDGMPVHRVVPGFVAQLGDPDGDGFGGADLPPLRCQVSEAPFELGSVGVALAGRDTGISQFFVTLRPAPHLAGEYTMLGKADPGFERLVPGDRISGVRVLEVPAK